MIFHENRLLADYSHEISYLIFLKIRKDIDVEKFVVCCSRDWPFKGYYFKRMGKNDRKPLLSVTSAHTPHHSLKCHMVPWPKIPWYNAVLIQKMTCVKPLSHQAANFHCVGMELFTVFPEGEIARKP